MYKDLMDTIGYVESVDPEVGSAMQKELARQKRNLELIALAARWAELELKDHVNN